MARPGPFGSGLDNECTIVNLSEANLRTCIQPGISTHPLFTDCQWPVANLDVTNNNFYFNPTHIENNEDPGGNHIPNPLPRINGSACANVSKSECGLNAMFSIYGSAAPYKAWAIANNVSNNNNNTWAKNCYAGPWNS